MAPTNFHRRLDPAIEILIDDRSALAAGNSAKHYQKSWRALVIMLVSLLAGLAVMLAHHFMNVALSGKPVSDTGLSQAWGSRFGTALAFLAKTFLVACVGASFIQRQWMSFHQTSYRLSDIDTITSVLGNVFGLLSSKIWFRNLVLMSVAIISWTIPFAVIVTPGTLSIHPVPLFNTSLMPVPQLSYLEDAYGPIEVDSLFQIASSIVINRLAYVTATTQAPATIPLPNGYLNQSYHLDFFGPTLKCQPANDSVTQEIAARYGPPRVDASGNLYSISVWFMAWVAQDMSIVYAHNKSNFPVLSNTIDYSSIDGARVFTYSIEGYEGVNLFDPPDLGINVTECILYNASYSADFNFTYPQQLITSNISTYLNPVSAPAIPMGNGSVTATDEASVSYADIMNAFNKLLVGTYGSDSGASSVYANTIYDLTAIDWVHRDATEAGLEQLFQNFTISLLSAPSLITNFSIATKVPVTVLSYPLTYIYDSWNLLLAYGLSLLFSVVACVIGIHAFLVNNGSYQNLSSTFLRATNESELRALISDGDVGLDPLPRRLGDVRVVMGSEAKEMQ